MIDDMLGGPKQPASPQLMLQDYKKFKHGKKVPEEAEIQHLKQHLLARALVHHKHVMHMSHARTKEQNVHDLKHLYKRREHLRQ